MPVLGLVTIGSLIIIVDQIKEIIMKKIIFWTALISILGLLIGACAKRDDDTAVTQWTVSCEDTTASGSITIGSDTASGTYLVLTANEFYNSQPATGVMPRRDTMDLQQGLSPSCKKGSSPLPHHS